MSFKNTVQFAAFIFIFLASSSLLAQNDIAGSQDHPQIPRIEGTNIIGYAYSEFDEADVITAVEEREFKKITVSGKRTRLIYSAPGTTSLPLIWNNYSTIFTGMGEVVDVYSCVAKACARNMGRAFVWAQNNRVPVSFGSSNFMYASLGYRDQRYTYYTVKTQSSLYHISLYAAYLTGIQAPEVKDIRAIHLDIVEEADFVPTLQVVSPEEITQGISEKGRIALYGINFGFDSDVIKSDSGAAIGSIAKALKTDSSLAIYVVGHTDNQGKYDYNVSLSKRRAAAVVKILTNQYKIAATRLIPVGVGPVAPVASNKTEQGQAKNRRVELVEF